MILKRKLGLTELEQRIAPAHTITLNAVTTFFDLQPDGDGDVVRVERDIGGVGTIDIIDNDATGPGDFDEIDSIVFNNDGCNATTNLVVRDINPGTGNDIATVGYIDFTAPAAIGTITLGVSGSSAVNVAGLNDTDSIGGTTLSALTTYGNIASIGTGDGIDLSSAFSGAITVNGNISAAGTGDGLEFDSAFTGTATVNGNISAAGAGASAAYFNAGLGGVGSLIVTGNLTGGNSSAIWVEGGDLAGTINVGDMAGKTIDQAGAFDITGAGITVGGNLGGILADGSIVNTTVDVGGNLANIQADWNGGGADTITNLNLTMSGGGDVTGSIDNNGAAQAMSLSVTSTAGGAGDGDFSGSIVSGGSLDLDFNVDDDFSGAITAQSGMALDFHADDMSGTVTANTGNIVFDGTDDFTVDTTMSNDMIATTGDIQFINGSTFDVGTMTGTASLNAGADILFTDSTIDITTFSDNANFTAGTNFTFNGDDTTGSAFNVGTFSGDMLAGTAITFEDAGMNWGDVQGTAQVTAGTSVFFVDGSLIADDFGATVTATANNIDFTDFTFESDDSGPGSGNFGGAFAANSGSILVTDSDFTVDGDFSGTWDADTAITFDPSSFTTYDFSGSWTVATGDMTFTASDFEVTNSMSGHLVATTGSVIFESDDVVTPSTFTVNTMAAAAYLEAGTNILFDGSDFDVTTMDGDLLTTAAGGGSIIFQADVAATPNASTFTVGTMSATGSLTGDGNVTFIDSTIAITDFQAGADFTATTGAFTFNGDNTTPSTFDVGTFSGDIMAATTISFIDADMDWGTVGAAANIQATLGNLSFSAGSLDVIDFLGDVDALDGNIVFSTFAFEADDSTNPGVVGNFGGTFDAADAGGSGDDGDILVTNSTFIVDNDASSVWNAARNITFDPSSFAADTFSGTWTAAVDMVFDNSTFEATTTMSGDLIATTGDIQFINDSTFTVGTMTGTGSLNAGTDILFTDSDVAVTTFSDNANFTAGTNFTFNGDDATDSTFDVTTFAGDIVATAGVVTFEDADMDWGDVQGTAQVTAGTDVNFTDGILDALDFAGTVTATAGDIDVTDFTIDIDSAVDGIFSGAFVAGNNIEFDPSSFAADTFSGTWTATNDITFTDSTISITTFTNAGSFNAGAAFTFNGDDAAHSTFTVGTFAGDILAGTTITFEDADMAWRDVQADADIQATLGDLTFIDGRLDVYDFAGDVDALDGNIVFTDFTFEADDLTNPGVLGNLAGTFDAADAGGSGDDGDILVTNSTFIVDNDTSSVWNAARNITFDPSSFTTYDFSGTWTAAVDMTFDASPFTVTHDMSGDLIATAGKIEFINGSTFTVGTMTGTGSLNAGTDILFTGSDVAVTTFSDNANFTAGANFTFNGNDTNNFTITTFDGDITATSADVTFVNGTFDFGTFNATGKVEATAGNIFFGDNDTPDSLDTFHTTLFEGTLTAPLGEVLFTEMNLVWDGGFGGNIIAGELNFVDGSLTIPVFYGTFEATGLGGKTGDIIFNNFPLHIDDSTGGTGDFSGEMLAAHDIHFIDSSFTVDGDFTATGLLQAGNHITFDPSPFEADNFYGTWTAASILMDAGSHFTVHRTMDGLVEATGADPDGFITFQDSNLYIETFGSVGQFIANTNFTFDGDGTNTFEIDFFEGDIIATTANVAFIDGTFDFGDFGANADVIATAGDILFGDDDDAGDTFMASVFNGNINAVAGTLSFTEMDIQFGDFLTDGLLTAGTAVVMQDGASGIVGTDFTADYFGGKIRAATLTFDAVDFDFGEFGESGLIQTTVDNLLFDGGTFTATIFDGTLKGPAVTFDTVTADFGDFGMHGLIESTVGDIKFDDTTFQANSFNGAMAAAGTIDFDPSPVHVEGDFGGTMTVGAGDFVFDANPFYVGGNMSGTLTTVDGSIQFINGSDFFVGGVMSGTIDANFVANPANVEFNGSDFFVQSFVGGTIVADNGIIFDNIGSFEIDFFDGTIEALGAADNAAFSNSTFDFGEMGADGLIQANQSVVFDTAPLLFDAFDGTIKAFNVDVTFGTSPITVYGGFGGTIIAEGGGDVNFSNSAFNVYGSDGFTGTISGYNNVDFNTSPLTISYDFDGLIFADELNIDFTDSAFDVGGDFTGTIEAEAGTVTFDPSPITVGDDFGGTISASSTLTFNGSNIDVGEDFTGKLESLNDDVVFNNGTQFTVAEAFSGDIEALAGGIKFDDGTALLIEGDFTGTMSALNAINFDPAEFRCGDFEGTWTAVGECGGESIIFDGSDFTVDKFKGTWSADEVIFQNGSTFTVLYDFEATGLIESTVTNIEFNDSDVAIGNFAGNITAAVDFVFNGDNVSYNTFTIGTFSGDLTATAGNVDFDDATVDLGNFTSTGDIKANVDATFTNGSLAADPFDGDIIASTGAVAFNNFPINVGLEGFGGLIDSALTMVFNDSPLTVSGDFSGTFDSGAAIDVDVSSGNAVHIYGDFTATGLWDAETDITVDGGSFIVDGEFDGALQANGDIDPVFYLNSDGTNDGQMIADADDDGVGNLVGTLYATGNFGTGAVFSGAEIPMSFYIDGTFSGQFLANYGGFDGTIDIGGNFDGYLYSADNLNAFYLGGYVLDNDFDTFEIDVDGDANIFDVYGMGPGGSASDAVVVRAANWQDIDIGCGGVGVYTEIRAGSGSGFIYNLRVEGPHIDNFVSAQRGFPGKWEISDSQFVDRRGFVFNVELDDSGSRDGSIKIKTSKRGDVMVWYMDSDFNENTITEITAIEWYSGDRPNLKITASRDLDPAFPAIGLIAAYDTPLGGLCGGRVYDYDADQYFAAGFRDIKVKRVDVENIEVSGSARNIRFYDASVTNVTIGHGKFFGDNDPYWDSPVGNLKSLQVKRGDIGHHSAVEGSVNILGNVRKIKADNIYGEINVGGNLRKVSCKYDFDADINVGGNFNHLSAKRAEHLDNDIIVGGKLKRISMKRAEFTGYVECSRLHHHFDVLGGKRDRTVDYFYHMTEATYDTYGLLRVFDIVPKSRIR